jgi:hypothetical protein
VKSFDQRTEFGGTAGAPLDTCYHLACDTAANVVTAQVASFAAIAAAASLALARGDLLP